MCPRTSCERPSCLALQRWSIPIAHVQYNTAYIPSTCLVVLSFLPGSIQAIPKISVAKLASCSTMARHWQPVSRGRCWYNGKRVAGETGGEEGLGFGGDGLLSFVKEWTTAHPRVDPKTRAGSLPFKHLYLHMYITRSYTPSIPTTPLDMQTRILNTPIPGVSSGQNDV